MAKTQQTGTNAGIQFDTIGEDIAQRELTELRGGRAGRTSAFAALFEAVKGLEDGKVIRLTLTKSQSLNLGQQMKKRFGDDIKVSTADAKDGTGNRAVYIMKRG